MARFLTLLSVALILAGSPLRAAGIDDFVGTYAGSAEFDTTSGTQKRDMSATIEREKKGFSVTWTSVTTKSDGRTKEKSYTIGFVPSDRENIFSSAMKTNVFGKQVPLDPLKGEPFVWARLNGDTLSVFSLFINETGEYEMQEYHRTLAEGGLELLFKRIQNGVAEREIQTFLERQ